MPILYEEISTPLGAMIAAATDTHLCLLEFAGEGRWESQVQHIQKHLGAALVPGNNKILSQTRAELAAYFTGERREFSVPTTTPGTEFQQAAWSALLAIPYGATRSYGQQAVAIGRPKAVRAVAKANSSNRLAIILPCHRVIGANGSLTGYAGLLWRKQALLDLECGGAQLSLSLL